MWPHLSWPSARGLVNSDVHAGPSHLPTGVCQAPARQDTRKPRVGEEWQRQLAAVGAAQAGTRDLRSLRRPPRVPPEALQASPAPTVGAACRAVREAGRRHRTGSCVCRDAGGGRAGGLGPEFVVEIENRCFGNYNMSSTDRKDVYYEAGGCAGPPEGTAESRFIPESSG